MIEMISKIWCFCSMSHTREQKSTCRPPLLRFRLHRIKSSLTLAGTACSCQGVKSSKMDSQWKPVKLSKLSAPPSLIISSVVDSLVPTNRVIDDPLTENTDLRFMFLMTDSPSVSQQVRKSVQTNQTSPGLTFDPTGRHSSSLFFYLLCFHCRYSASNCLDRR